MGMLFAALAFISAGLLQRVIVRYHTANGISIWWQIPQYVFISLAEACVGATGLEFAYSDAPGYLKATVTSMWFLVQGFGEALLVLLTLVPTARSPETGEPPIFYFICAGLMLAVGLYFWQLSQKYQNAK